MLHAITDPEIQQMVLDRREKHGHGSRRIVRWLAEQGVALSEFTVDKIIARGFVRTAETAEALQVASRDKGLEAARAAIRGYCQAEGIPVRRVICPYHEDPGELFCVRCPESRPCERLNPSKAVKCEACRLEGCPCTTETTVGRTAAKEEWEAEGYRTVPPMRVRYSADWMPQGTLRLGR